MKELQEQDPLVGQLRKQWSEKKLDKKLFTMEDEILKKKTIINGILYTPHSSSRCAKRLSIDISTRQTGTQWIQKNPQFTQAIISLEGHEENYPKTLQCMHHVCKTQH